MAALAVASAPCSPPRTLSALDWAFIDRKASVCEEIPLTRALSCTSLGVPSVCDSEFGLSERQLGLAAHRHSTLRADAQEGHHISCERGGQEVEAMIASADKEFEALASYPSGSSEMPGETPHFDSAKACLFMDSLGLLDCSRQLIHQLPSGLRECAGVQVALLSENRLVSFQTPCSWLATLIILDISANQLTVFPDLTGCQLLRCLVLAWNRLSMVGPAGAVCPRLAELRLAGNRLSSLRGLHEFPNLVRLDIGDNRIAGLAPLRLLSARPCLRALALSGNPVVALRGLPVLLANLLPQLEACDVPGLTRAVHRYRRCGAPAFFCGERYCEEVGRLQTSFSHLAFLSTLPGGLGPEAQAPAQSPARASAPVVASALPRARRRAEKTIARQVGSLGYVATRSARCNPLERPERIHAEHQRNPVAQTRTGASNGPGGQLSTACLKRLPSAWSSAFSDMTCTSLRQRLQAMDGHSRCIGLPPDTPPRLETSKDKQGILHMEFSVRNALPSTHASDSPTTASYGPKHFECERAAEEDVLVFERGDPPLDGLACAPAQDPPMCDEETATRHGLEPIALTPRFPPAFFRGERGEAWRGDVPDKELHFHVGCAHTC
mmetsp:Transcript_137459/g.383333  ORF Transcript_137459/g.383333 Transcript_137459/m.383333 type:complete len:610 (-) Transcript_137459:56-1885(-)